MRLASCLTLIALALATWPPAAPAATKPKRASSTASAPAHHFMARDDVQAFAADVAQRHGLEPAHVRAQLAQAVWVAAVRKHIMPPPAGTAKNWAAYRAIFVEPRRIKAGLDFWRKHQLWLQRAEVQPGSRSLQLYFSPGVGLVWTPPVELEAGGAPVSDGDTTGDD